MKEVELEFDKYMMLKSKVKSANWTLFVFLLQLMMLICNVTLHFGLENSKTTSMLILDLYKCRVYTYTVSKPKLDKRTWQVWQSL